MKRWQRIIYLLFVGIVFILLLSGCSGKRPIKPLMDNDNLNGWLGDYEFYEYFPPNINMEYNINIYKENGDYFAKIYIDGFQTTKKIKAKVLSNQDGINLVFETYLPDSTGQDLNKGDVLLGFKKVDSEIYTNWGKIEPTLPENKPSGKVYFTKVKE